MPWTTPYRPPKNERLVPEIYRDPSRVCYITIRAYRYLCPFVEPRLNRLMVELLRAEQERQGCKVFAYRLMPDHLHLLVSPCEEGASVSDLVDRFKVRMTNESWKLGWKGKLWQPRYYDHVVRRDEDLAAIALYVLHNPVRKGLVECREEWPWSGETNRLPTWGRRERAQGPRLQGVGKWARSLVA